MKPLFKWNGGKTQEIIFFKKFYPEKFNLFVEPFIGGGSVFFDLEFENNIINDLNDDLINFYKIIKNNQSKQLYDLLIKSENTENFFYEIRDSFSPKNDIEKAYKFIYLRNTCFRGLVRYNKSGKFNVPYGNYKKINYDLLLDNKYLDLLSKTVILNDDYKNIFINYNDTNNFFFLDPPYHQTEDKYNSEGFNEKEHFLLSENIKNTKNKCLMIIGKTDYIYSLYKDLIIEEYNKKYAMTVYSKIKKDNIHLIIKNY